MASSKTLPYDVLIVGAGIAGCALAHGLSTLPNTPLRIAVLERSLAEPDRIVGELLQPGGVAALKELGLGWCLEGIDSIPTKGYFILNGEKTVHIPYPGKHEGRAFHHGRFIMKLREAVIAAKPRGVDLIEATVNDLIEEDGRVVGVRATRVVQTEAVNRKEDVDHDDSYVSKTEARLRGDGAGEAAATDSSSSRRVEETYRAKLVIIADGCSSRFRDIVMGTSATKPIVKGYFMGAVLENVTLPMPQHGTVGLIKGFGPVLLYQIGKAETRILIDIRNPAPSDALSVILDEVVPQLPSNLHAAIRSALTTKRLRRMPNAFLPPVEQGLRGSKAGVVLIGDSWNMRHPLTGGGMTVAFSDVVLLRELLGGVKSLDNWSEIRGVLQKWHWSRKSLASTVNILSVALYDLFSAEDEDLEILRTGCFKYFERGGECVNGPVSLLSGIARSPTLLANHFFSVAFYAIWIMFTHPRVVNVAGATKGDKKTIIQRPPSFYRYPSLALKGVQVLYVAAVVFLPLVWSEIRWWSPSDRRPLMIAMLPHTLVIAAAIASVVYLS